jgi:hypothetical protein
MDQLDSGDRNTLSLSDLGVELSVGFISIDSRYLVSVRLLMVI